MSEAMRRTAEARDAQHRVRRPIIVAVGAAGGTSSLEMAHAIAARDASDLIVSSVVEPPPIFAIQAQRALLLPWTVGKQMSERRIKVHDRLHRLGWKSDETSEPPVEITFGEPADEIAKLARERNAQLIVMGSGPHTLARRLLAADTTLSTTRRAPCPVLAVPEGARTLPRVAVIATDFSPESISAALDALPLLADGAVVHLVHAWTPIETLVPVHELTAMDDAYLASLPERFTRLRSLIGHGRTLFFKTTAAVGKPADVVLAIAAAEHADIIVAGTHGYGMLERWIVGSTSTAILRAADCSVLLSPEPSAVERARLQRHMTGTSTVREPQHWDEELRGFVQRNHDRRTSLEIDDRNIGAQMQQSGYALVGASYDPHDRHIALMFGGDGAGTAHLTRSLGHVHSVAVARGPRDEDRALCIESEDGSALLTFIDHASVHPSSANA